MSNVTMKTTKYYRNILVGLFLLYQSKLFQSKSLSLVNLYYIHVHLLLTRLINIDTSSYANKTKKKRKGIKVILID